MSSYMENIELVALLSQLYDDLNNTVYEDEHEEEIPTMNEDINEYDLRKMQAPKTKYEENKKKINNFKKEKKQLKMNKFEKKNIIFSPLDKSKSTMYMEEDNGSAVQKHRNNRIRNFIPQSQINDELCVQSPNTMYYIIYGIEDGEYYTAKAMLISGRNFSIEIIKNSKRYAETNKDKDYIKKKIKKIKKKTNNTKDIYKNTNVYVNKELELFNIYSDAEDEFLASKIYSQINMDEVELLATKIQSHPTISEEQKNFINDIINQIKESENIREPSMMEKIFSKVMPQTDRSVSGFINTTKTTMVDSVKQLTDIVSQARTDFSESVVKILIIAIFIVALRDRKKVLCILLVPLVLNLLAPTKIDDFITWVRGAIEYIADLVKGYIAWQKADLSIEIQGNVAAWIELIPGLLFGKRIYDEFSDGNLTKALTYNINNAKQGLNDIVQIFFNVVEKVTSTIGCTNLLSKYGMSLFTDDGLYIQYAEKVREFDERVSMGELKLARENYETLLSLLKEGRDLQVSIMKNKNGTLISSCLGNLLRGLENLQKQFRNSGFANVGLRQEPVCILLRGSPGTFKTQTVQHLCRALCTLTLEGRDKEAFMTSPDAFYYNRQIETEYWEGYNSTKHITIIDDFGQYREVSGATTSESMEMIRMINENPASLHMASLESKANTTFSSKFVIATTNSVTINTATIIDRKALLRRFGFVYTVVPKKEFRKDGETDPMLMSIDKTKLPLGELGITSTRPDILLEFHEFDLATHKYTGKILTLDEIIIKAVESYKFKKTCYEQKLLELDETVSRWNNQDTSKIVSQMAVCEDEPEIDGIYDTLEVPKLMKFPVNNLYAVGISSSYRTTSDYSFKPTVLLGETKDAYGTLLEYYKDICDMYGVNPAYYTLLKRMDTYELFCHHESLTTILMHVSQKYDEDLHILHSILVKDDYMFLVRLVEMYTDTGDLSHAVHLCTESIDDYNEQHNFLKHPIFCSKQSWNRFRAKLSQGVQNMYAWVKNIPLIQYAKIAASLGVITFFITVCYSLYKQYSGQEKVVPESGLGRKPRKPKIPRRSFIRNVPQISLTTDVQCQDILRKVLKSNAFEIRVRRSKDLPFVRSGQGLFLTGTYMLLPHHFLDHFMIILEEGDHQAQIELVPTYNESTKISTVTMFLKDFLGVTIDGEEISSPENAYQTETMLSSDLAIVDVPRIAPKSNIIKYFVTRDYINNMNTRLTIWLGQNTKVTEMTQSAGRVRNEVAVDSISYQSFSLPTAIEYNIATKIGDCGAIMAIADVSNPTRKLGGMHVAGNTSYGIGYSSLITYDDIVEFFSLIERKEEIEASLGTNTSEMQCGATSFMSSNKVVEDEAPRITYPIGTKIMRSPLYSEVSTSTMLPSSISLPNDAIAVTNPWFNSYGTYNMNPVFADFEEIRLASHMYKDMLFSNSDVYIEPRLYTFEEAVVGIPGSEYGALNRGTSAGYPDILQPAIKTSKRKYYFGDEDDYNLNSQECNQLRKEVDSIISEAKKNIRSQHVYIDYLKDEIRDIQKVRDNKTRLFSASPLRLLIVYRMYFGAYQQWFQVNRINNQSTIGLNVYSTEWNVLAKRLLSKAPFGSKNIGAGDYKGFDGSENPSIHWEILNIINEFYGNNEEDNRVRKILWYELVNSLHYFNGQIFEWTSSLPSGHPMTAIVNNMYNGIAFRFCWRDIFKQSDLVDKFEENVYLATMGDDNVFAVSVDVKDKFNEATIAKSMELLGLHYTKEDKTTPDNTLRDITEVEFLKRQWRYEPTLRKYVAPLRLSRVLETLNWTKKGPYSTTIPRDNVITVLRELSLHSKEKFDFWVPRILKKSRELLDYYPPLTERNALLREVTNMQLNF